MGANIPLPALDIKPPQQQGDPTENFLRLKSILGQQQMQQQQIQAGQQESQIRQQEINDQQAATKAMQSWDGKDVTQIPALLIKNGASAKTVFAAQSQIIQQRAKLSEIAKNDADTGSTNLKSLAQKNDMLLGKLNGVTDGPSLLKAAQESVQEGLIDPQHAQMAQQLAQLPPDKLQQSLDGFKKSLMGQKEQFSQAQAKLDQQTKQAQLPGIQAESQLKQMQLQGAQQGGMVPGIPVENQEAAQYLKQNPGKTLVDYQRWKASLSPQAQINLQGGAPNDALVQAVANGSMKIGDVLTYRTPLPIRKQFLGAVLQANPSFNSANFDIEKGVMKDFTSGTSAKNLTAFNTAIAHANQLQQATDALDNNDTRALNKIGNAIGFQFGSDKMTNFNVIKTALSGEISKVFKGGQATDAEIKEVQGPFDAANSPAQLRGAIQNAIHLMNSKRDALRQQYEAGRQAQPNFGTSAPAGAKPSSGNDPLGIR